MVGISHPVRRDRARDRPGDRHWATASARSRARRRGGRRARDARGVSWPRVLAVVVLVAATLPGRELLPALAGPPRPAARPSPPRASRSTSAHAASRSASSARASPRGRSGRCRSRSRAAAPRTGSSASRWCASTRTAARWTRSPPSRCAEPVPFLSPKELCMTIENAAGGTIRRASPPRRPPTRCTTTCAPPAASSSCSRSSSTCTASRTRSSCRRTHLDDLLSEGAGFAGFAAGDIGQGPNDPDMIAMPDPRTLHAAAVAAGGRALRLRRDRRGRGVAVLPAHDPAPPARARAAELGFEFKIGVELEYFLVRRRADGGDRARRPARHARAALLRHARADAQPRLRRRGVAQPQRARLGQLRHRPRGRQRPVRAELRLRRRADDLRPRDLLPLHGRVARAGARADRDVHAQAVPAPDRQRLPLPHEPVEGRRERLRRRPRRRPPQAWGSRPPRTTSSPGSRRTPRPTSR